MNGFASDFMVRDADLNTILTDRGLHIVSDAKIYCNLRVQAGNGERLNATLMTTKGQSALGRSFRIGYFSSPSWHSNKSSTIGIYATEDNTQISINLTSRKPVLRVAPAPLKTANIINVELNKGKTYMFAIKKENSNLNKNKGMIRGLGVYNFFIY